MQYVILCKWQYWQYTRDSPAKANHQPAGRARPPHHTGSEWLFSKYSGKTSAAMCRELRSKLSPSRKPNKDLLILKHSLSIPVSPFKLYRSCTVQGDLSVFLSLVSFYIIIFSLSLSVSPIFSVAFMSCAIPGVPVQHSGFWEPSHFFYLYLSVPISFSVLPSPSLSSFLPHICLIF